MEQYEKSGPPQEKKNTNDETDSRIDRLGKQCDEQAKIIADLQKEVRRLKTKLDAHAAVINQSKRG